jgi:hypothetical protein
MSGLRKVEMSGFIPVGGGGMETERIELSARKRERLKARQQVEEGHLKQVEAARRLRLTAELITSSLPVTREELRIPSCQGVTSTKSRL